MGSDGIHMEYSIIHTICLLFHYIPTTFEKQGYFGPNSINYAEGGIPGGILDETP